MLVGDKIILLNPLSGRQRHETGPVSVGKELLKAIREHNRDAPDDKQVPLGNSSERKLSRDILKTAGMKLAASSMFRRHMGTLRYNAIRKMEGVQKFTSHLDTVIRQINDDYPTVAYAEGNWCAHAAVVEKLSKLVSHNEALAKKAQSQLAVRIPKANMKDDSDEDSVRPASVRTARSRHGGNQTKHAAKKYFQKVANMEKGANNKITGKNSSINKEARNVKRAREDSAKIGGSQNLVKKTTTMKKGKKLSRLLCPRLQQT